MFDSQIHRSNTPESVPGPTRPKVLVLFGTRPETIKLAPVIHELKRRNFRTLVVSSSQHKQLLKPFLAALDVEVDIDLGVMKRNQSPNDVCSSVVAKLDKVLVAERPDLILVQGDTTTTLAGALAGFNRQIPVGHVEAGLRSGNPLSPFPEEMNRRMVSQMATLHFASTDTNRRTLISEGVASEKIFVTGNPVVDSLKAMTRQMAGDERIDKLIKATAGKKRILLTTHRRESFGAAMSGNLEAVRQFVERHKDVCVFFPVHPNPNVRGVADQILGGHDRIHLLEPMDYSAFLALMKASWLIVSDSGGVQEEAPSLGKPLLILRENTERPEAVHAGVAKLVGIDPGALAKMLEKNYTSDTWTRSVRQIANPFGDGHAAAKIVRAIEQNLAVKRALVRAA